MFRIEHLVKREHSGPARPHHISIFWKENHTKWCTSFCYICAAGTGPLICYQWFFYFILQVFFVLCANIERLIVLSMRFCSTSICSRTVYLSLLFIHIHMFSFIIFHLLLRNSFVVIIVVFVVFFPLFRMHLSHLDRFYGHCRITIDVPLNNLIIQIGQFHFLPSFPLSTFDLVISYAQFITTIYTLNTVINYHYYYMTICSITPCGVHVYAPCLFCWWCNVSSSSDIWGNIFFPRWLDHLDKIIYKQIWHEMANSGDHLLMIDYRIFNTKLQK